MQVSKNNKMENLFPYQHSVIQCSLHRCYKLKFWCFINTEFL